MSKKLKRVLDEIEKTEGKIAVWQEHLQELNLLREQLENQEIIKSVRSLKLDGRRMLELLDGIQNGTVPVQWIEKFKSGIQENMDGTQTIGQKKMLKDTASESEDYHEEI